MAMGKRPRSQQPPLFVPAEALLRAAHHPFYDLLNRVLAEHGFDAFVESRCGKFYHGTLGRPSLAPGRYFRMLLVGYFEGIDSERGIAWRVHDSLSLRNFIGYGLDETPADHSTLSRTRRLIDAETHREVFGCVLKMLAENRLIDGRTLGIDATTLEANAAMRSIVRRDDGRGYQEFLGDLARASGIETPTREDLAKIDKGRKNKASNDDWQSPDDPDARIAKMKDGTTHLAHKAEHVVDLGENGSGAVLAVVLHEADAGDTETMLPSLIEATSHLRELADDPRTCDEIAADFASEVVADRGYHSNDTLTDLAELETRSYLSEPDRGKRRWKGKSEARRATYGNRRRIRGARGKRLLRRRGEYLERSFAHAYETGGMRRLHLRGRENILKRLLVHVGGLNLGILMRKLCGAGTPRGLRAAFLWLWGICMVLWMTLRLILACQSARDTRFGVAARFRLAA